MMRIGAAADGQISLDVADDTKTIGALDEMPGAMLRVEKVMSELLAW